MATFTLEPAATNNRPSPPTGAEGLSRAVLFQDARWFTLIRWGVVATFIAIGSVARWMPDALATLGIKPPPLWPWILAAIVASVNIFTIAWLRRIQKIRQSRAQVEANIWLQIVADLMVLTLLVHLVGSVNTVMPFAYLFHVTLACIFFAPRKSIIVLSMSIALFLSVVLMEIAGYLPVRSILMIHPGVAPSPTIFMTTTLPTVFVWSVVWFLVSHISNAVRRRDRDLDAANQRLRQADEEKNRQMMRVTHDLKAPFAGIESNIQVLRLSHWDKIPEEVRKIIGRIESRCATLRARIGDILILGNLRQVESRSTAAEKVSIRELTTTVINDLRDTASQRNVRISVVADSESVLTDPKQFKILLQNLIANAVFYSHEGGTVTITVVHEEPVRIRIHDDGIGISEDALPNIFTDFFSSQEATQFNPHATGLGLAIVRQVAHNLGLTINVNSTKGKGATFEVVVPLERSVQNDHN